eukprot:TRINITY_DN11334_c0_g1_i1.p1 TRINITY_DN11334_c0_g1~~TRINITY_DN11334_c0_g1_i1.p1  ORF type:complete len:495 (-),score=110.46 TRINITY_DN11334_c0_g1_i1:60-1544(-)
MEELPARVEKLELLTRDYVKALIEPEAQAKYAKLHKNYLFLAEKFDAIMFLVKNFYIINHKYIESGLQLLRDALGGSGHTQGKVGKVKEQFAEEVFRMARLMSDARPEYVRFVLELVFMLVANDEAMSAKAYDAGIFRVLIHLVRRQGNKDAMNISLIKNIGVLTRFEDYLNLIESSGITSNLVDIIISIIEQYFIPLNETLYNDQTNKELSSAPLVTITEESDFLVITETGERRANLGSSGLRDTTQASEVVYYAMMVLYNLTKREGLLAEMKQEKIVPLLMDTLRARKATKTIRLILVKYFKNICRIEANVRLFKSEETLNVVLSLFAEKSTEVEIKRILMEFFDELCQKDQEIQRFFESMESKGAPSVKRPVVRKSASPKRNLGRPVEFPIDDFDQVRTLNRDSETIDHNNPEIIKKPEAPSNQNAAARELRKFRSEKYRHNLGQRSARTMTPPVTFTDTSLPRIRSRRPVNRANESLTLNTSLPLSLIHI